MKRYTLPLFAVALMLSVAFAGTASAQANKVAAVGSTVATFPINTTATLLSTTIKTSTNADLLIQFTSECDIGIGDLDVNSLNTFTSNSTFNGSFTAANISGAGGGSGSTSTNAFSSANAGAAAQESDSALAQVRVWVEVDGVPVRIEASNPDGSVVLCRKTYDDFSSDTLNLNTSLNTNLGQSLSVFSSDSIFISQGTSTGTGTSTTVGTSEQNFRFDTGAQTNGFNWSARNVGQGTHTVEVKAHVFGFINSAGGTFTSGGGSGSGSVFTSGNASANASGSGGGGGFADTGSFGSSDAPFITGAIGKRTLVIEPVSMSK